MAKENILEEIKRHQQVLLEEFQSRIGVVAEGVLANNEKSDTIIEQVVKLSEDMTIVKQDLSFIKNELKRKVDYEEFSVLEQRVAKLESKVR